MAIPGELKHRHKRRLDLYPPWEELESWQRAEIKMTEPPKEKIKRIKKTINLIGQDDSALTIAYHTYKIIKKYHPDRHQVMITFMEWTSGSADAKQKLISYLFADYDPVWQIRLEQKGEVVVAKCTFPGMLWLTF